MTKGQLEEIIRKEVRRNLKEGLNSDERKYADNLKRDLIDISKLLDGWSKRVDSGNLDESDFNFIISQLSDLIRTIKRHKRWWNN